MSQLPSGEEIYQFQRERLSILKERVESLTEANRRLRTALEHYADESNWLGGHDSVTGTKQVYAGSENGWQIAQDALKK